MTCHSRESQISYLSCKLGTAVILLYTLWNSSARYLPFHVFMPDDDSYGCKHVTVCKVYIFVQAIVLTEIVCVDQETQCNVFFKDEKATELFLYSR